MDTATSLAAHQIQQQEQQTNAALEKAKSKLKQDQEEAIDIANDTEYGLGAGVFTKDLKKASWTASKLEAGQVYVNKWFTGNHATPFGGYKQSGYSREKGVDGLKSYLQVKNVGISLG